MERHAVPHHQGKENGVSTIVKMETLPACDFCEETAGYDARTKMGPWAYMCESCFNNNGTGQLGTGYGQRLVKDGEDIVMSWGEVAELTHKTQVELFNFCTCEDGPSVYEGCPTS